MNRFGPIGMQGCDVGEVILDQNLGYGNVGIQPCSLEFLIINYEFPRVFVATDPNIFPKMADHPFVGADCMRGIIPHPEVVKIPGEPLREKTVPHA